MLFMVYILKLELVLHMLQKYAHGVLKCGNHSETRCFVLNILNPKTELILHMLQKCIHGVLKSGNHSETRCFMLYILNLKGTVQRDGSGRK
jgi:hypothetical protein